MKTTINNTAKLLVALFTVSIFTVSCAQNKTEGPSEVTAEVSNTIKAPEMDIQGAVISGNLDMVKQHIAAGSDLIAKEPMSGSTPLMTAITFDKIEIAEELIKAGADLSITNNDGGTALHNAAFFGKVEVVQLLIDAKADKTVKNNWGATPRETVMGDFAEIKPVYDMLILQLQPMGFSLDLEQVEKARPVIAMMLE